MAIDINPTVQDADNVDKFIRHTVKNQVLLDRQHAQTVLNFRPGSAQIRMLKQLPNPLLKLANIIVGLIPAPLTQGINPNILKLLLGDMA